MTIKAVRMFDGGDLELVYRKNGSRDKLLTIYCRIN
jgi:hypothetical protein